MPLLSNSKWNMMYENCKCKFKNLVLQEIVNLEIQ